jgi:pimeloyl-ACP methyl ester carboxylesterase
MRHLRLALACAALLAACGSISNDSAAPLEHRRGGAGAAVVVFQSGHGDGLSVWNAVQPRTDAFARTVAFSRPGYGRSLDTSGERSPCRAAEEQRALLKRAGLSPPYVLVGHSLGGLYQYAYALLHPDEVAALVLLEPTHPDHWATIQRDAPVNAALVNVARTRFSATMRREFDDQTACVSKLDQAKLARVPVRLLVRGEFRGLEAGAFEVAARRLASDWARRLRIDSPTIVEGAGHYIQRDKPNAVLDAIASTISAPACQARS